MVRGIGFRIYGRDWDDKAVRLELETAKVFPCPMEFKVLGWIPAKRPLELAAAS